jgi:ABC exporter DevB family membrane fusion protein
VTVLIALSALAWAAFAENHASAPTRGKIVVAAGRTEPVSEELELAPEMAGRLRVFVEEGERIRRGQLVAQIENGDFTARIGVAKALIAEREAAVTRSRAGSRPMEMREAAARVREAEAVLENARIERDRRAGMLAQGVATTTEANAAERDYNVAKARVDALKEHQAVIDNDVRPEDVRKAEAAVDLAKAQLTEAQAMFAKTLIHTPVSGVVLRRHKRTGESATAGTAILTIGDTSRMNVRVEVDETDVARVAVGMKAWVTAPAHGDRKFTGKVVRVGLILGRKKIRTDAPTEKLDAKVLETLVELDEPGVLPVGLRVDAFIEGR